ncbi:hypothetical protein F53441_3198 [Fusarium austroafricanum]|uniref:Glucose-methanol-choline oxidoreductase N-terminal domain-containing protein n=1 Tax=Fusarium austroafricanum TaxID=2364996 RepID=A0A8H4KS03_9HYPO|nr:hypothetical protein F53441_3198 [Fusarium austroafricanum]
MAEHRLKKIRPLGKLEELSAVAHEIDFFTNTGLSARYTSSQPSPDFNIERTVYVALSQVLGQNPVLFAVPVISNNEETYWGRLPSIDLKTVVSFVERSQPWSIGDQTDEELDTLLENEHNINFKDQYGILPVWRLIILQDHNSNHGFTACFIAHHSMTDGTGLQIFHDSFQRALCDLSSALTELKDDRVILSNDDPIAPSLEELHPLPLPTTSLKSDDACLTEWRGNPIGLPCKTRYKSLSLAPKLMESFVQDCKKHKVAPTAALPSLVARLLYDNLPSTTESLTCNLPVSLRSDLPPKLVEGVLGNYIDAFKVQLLRSDLDPASDDSSASTLGIWKHAKKIQRETRRYFANSSPSGELYANVAVLKLIPDIGAALAGSIGSPRGESFEVSNLGTFPQPKNLKGGINPSWRRGKVLLSRWASGLTVANRLSENSAVSVLVIEAGEFDNNEDYMTIPGLAGGAVGTKYDWNLTYPSTASLNGRNVSAPLGKVVGGSTKLNRMVFDRGSQSDYDRWAELGNGDWQWKSLLPYFKKSEKFTGPTANIKKEYGVTTDASAHGSSGFIHSSYSPWFWPTTKTFVKATGELGIDIPVDQANGNAIGGYFCPHNLNPKTVARSSAQDYYSAVSQRKNLQLLTGNQVTRVITSKNGSSVKATGVEFAKNKDSARKTVKAKKEVILAAGSIHTPQILQVSGIGDPALLSSIKVPVVVDLPAVGQNFHDHVLLAVVNTINAPLQTGNLTNNATFAAEARAQYDQQKKGPLTSPTGDFLLFLPLSNYTSAASDIHKQATSQDASKFLPSGTPAEVVKGYKKQQKILNGKLLDTNSAMLEIIWADGTSILGLQHPYSRGSVKAKSSNIFDSPEANPELLKNPLDVALLVEGVKFTRKLSSAPSIKALSPVELVPGANVTSDSDIEQFIRSSASTLFHPAGSCKIGSRSDGGVVDEKLRVYGVSGLRIVDASVMPLLPATHTMTTVYAVAEKAADLIKLG